MSRRKTDPIVRIARCTDVTPEYIHEILTNPALGTGQGSCIPWKGAITGWSPMIHLDGRAQPTRRVLLNMCLDEPLAKTTVVKPGCMTPFCINPNHTLVQHQVHATPPVDADPEPIEDIIDAVYSRDPPWDAAQLAEEFGYEVGRVLEAIARIQEEGL